jgi:hypothetical protein
MKSRTFYIPGILILVMLLLLSGCGGGTGGNGDTGNNPNPPPGAPATPLNLIATAGNAQTVVSWSQVADATSYTLYWGTSPNLTTSSSKISGLSATSYTHTNRLNGTTYYYKVSARNASGESTLSTEVSTTPFGQAPPQPQITSVTPGKSQTVIAWSSAASATGYVLYWSTSSPVTTASAKITALTGTSYTHTGLSGSGSYYYRLAAVNASGESPLSGEVPVRLAQGMSLSINSPSAGGLTGDPLAVVVIPASTYEITGVSAQLGNSTYPLAYDACAVSYRVGCTAGWIGSIPLTGFARGIHMLTVNASDAAGGSVSTTRSFEYDKQPVLTVNSPAESAVIRTGSIRVVASCSDDDPAGCATVSAYANSTLLGSSQGSMDQTFALSAADGSSVTIRVDAADSRGQKVSASRTVLVESLPGLTEVATAGGDILDFAADRILYVDTSGTTALKIRSIAASTDTLVAQDGQKTPVRGGLTPAGALYVMKGSGDIYGQQYDFRNGASEYLGLPESSFEIAGSYALWFGYDLAGTSDYLYLRNLSTGSNNTIVKYNYSSGINPSKGNNNVAANGDVVYWTTYTFDTNIIRSRNGVVTRITNDLGAASGIPLWYQNRNPKTDGYNICYTKQEYRNPGGAGSTSLYLHNGSQELLLSAPFGTDSYDSTPSFQYELNNGWTAYTKPGTTNQSQIWLRSSDGSTTQVTFFSASSSIVSLASNGELMLSNGGRLYLYRPGQSGLTDIASTRLRPKHLSGQWHYALGRTIFR